MRFCNPADRALINSGCDAPFKFRITDEQKKLKYMIYDVHYFINKFEAIPEEMFCAVMDGDNGAHCYIGHCSTGEHYSTNEHFALGISLLYKKLKFGAGSLAANRIPKYQHLTIKQRILAALYDIRAMQEPKVKTVYVTVSEVIKDETKKLILN